MANGSAMLRGVRRSLAAAAVVACLAAPAAAQYMLQPGDAVRFSVAGLPELSTEAVVGVDGLVRIPQFGAIVAKDRTLEELEDTLRSRIANQMYKRYGADGVPVFIALDPLDVVIDMAAYRPVYVSGDVAQPGAVAFRPGLSVRAAIASAGGPRAGGLLRRTDDPERDEARLQGDYQALWLEGANLRARIWRLRAALVEDPSLPPPTASSLAIGDDLYAEVLDMNRAQLEVDLAAIAGQRSFVSAAISQAEERLDILRQQSENQAIAVKDDEDELGRVKQLFDRGVVPIGRFLDIRRAQLASATRFLQTEDSLARVTLERTRFLRDADAIEESRREAIYSEIAEGQRRLRELAVRLATTRRQLEIIGASPRGLAPASSRIEVALHRGVGPAVVAEAIDLDALLMPGDIIEVTVFEELPFEPSETNFSGG